MAVALVFAMGEAAWATCPTIDFEDRAVGTVITTQYRGVTFSGRDTDGTAGVNPIIFAPAGGTTSGTRALSAAGSGEFSCEFLRLHFANLQREVTFSLGIRYSAFLNNTVRVRYYDDALGLIDTINLTVRGDLSDRVTEFVRVGSSTGPAEIRRIEIEGNNPACQFEMIDDLSFDVDTTAPVAEITSPAQLACVCSGVSIVGSANDPDGQLKSWKLQRKALGATSWTYIVVSSTTPKNNEQLAVWTPGGTATDGWYTLRLTVTNECGLETVWTTDVYFNRAFNDLVLRSPTNGAIVGGGVCADGTAWDHCGGSFTLEHRPAAGGAWVPFDAINPPWILYDPLGSWNTRVGTPDGNYEVRLVGTDDCGNSVTSPVATVTVDNTAPTAVITSPLSCSYVNGVVQVRGTANDAHLAGWTLYYSGGDVHEWTSPPDWNGNAPVIDGVLGNWDTNGLRRCAYTLRLVVTDSAVLDCNGTSHNQREYTVSVNVGGNGGRFDSDNDGDVDLADFLEFQGCFNGPNRPPACP